MKIYCFNCVEIYVVCFRSEKFSVGLVWLVVCWLYQVVCVYTQPLLTAVCIEHRASFCSWLDCSIVPFYFVLAVSITAGLFCILKWYCCYRMSPGHHIFDSFKSEIWNCYFLQTTRYILIQLQSKDPYQVLIVCWSVSSVHQLPISYCLKVHCKFSESICCIVF